MLLAIMYHIGHILGYAGEFFFIVVNDLLGFCAADAQVLCQTKCALPINNSKVYTLGLPAHFFGHSFFFYTIHLGCGCRVDVLVLAESLAHAGVSAQCCYYS